METIWTLMSTDEFGFQGHDPKLNSRVFINLMISWTRTIVCLCKNTNTCYHLDVSSSEELEPIRTAQVHILYKRF